MLEKILKIHGHTITIQLSETSGTISSDLKEACPYCEQSECYFSCENSKAAEWMGDPKQESEDVVNSRRAWNSAVDGLESLILAHACEAHHMVEDTSYQKGIEVAIEAMSAKFH